MYKTIKVDEPTHLALKIGASNRGISIKEHLSKMANDLVNGMIFDVESHTSEWLEAVKEDIEIELEKRNTSVEQDNFRYIEMAFPPDRTKEYNTCSVCKNLVDDGVDDYFSCYKIGNINSLSVTQVGSSTCNHFKRMKK